MKTKLFLLTLSTCLVLNLQAQKKLDEALYQFQNTAFMQQFRSMKNKAAGEIVVFKQTQDKYSPRDVQKVKMVYDETARRFNKVLTDIKRDFLDKRKMKYIQQFPDSYSKGLELELYKLSDFYRTSFQQTVRDVTGEETFGNPLLALLPQLVMLSSDLIKQMQKVRRESAQFTESYLQEKLVQPNRFLYWQEVGQSNNNYNTNNGGGWDNNSNDSWNNNGNSSWDNSNNNGWDNNGNTSNGSWDNSDNNNNSNSSWENNKDWNTNSTSNDNYQGSNNPYQKQKPTTALKKTKKKEKSQIP